VPRIYQEADALIEYAEPINSRIFRKARSLSEEAQRRFVELRDEYAALGFLALGIWANRTVHKLAPLELPLKKEQGAETMYTADKSHRMWSKPEPSGAS
jgi:hypothetical protein